MCPLSDYAAADQRYLLTHIDPNMIPCGVGAWYVPAKV